MPERSIEPRRDAAPLPADPDTLDLAEDLGPGYNTPVDHPNHYDFRVTAVPLDPEERTPPTHRQHLGGYRLGPG